MSAEQEYQHLYAEARRYDEAGDVYHAVKLYKRLCKLAPDWANPYYHLGEIYKRRGEWKPAFHYFKKTVALQPAQPEAWWGLGIAATGLRKTNIARSVWTKFGQEAQRSRRPRGLQLKHQDGFEILWVQPLDAARCRILSIPHPNSGFRFRQEMLYDRYPVGHQVVGRRRVPVHACLGALDHSPFQTFSCLLHTTAPADVKALERLCRQQDLGFEVWSNATRAFTPEHRSAFPEYYSDILPPNADGELCVVAIAALHEAVVQRLLNSWQIITVSSFSDLRSY